MKKLIFLAALVVLTVISAEAQTVGSTSLITGTNYFPILISPGVYQTNQVFQSGAYKTITLGNIASTNETVTGYYVFNPTNGLIPAPGFPGYYIAGSFTNSFASGTNNGSFSTTFNSGGTTVYCPVYLGLALTGTNLSGSAVTNSAYVP